MRAIRRRILVAAFARAHTQNRTMTSQHLALIRYYEQLNSAKVLGVPAENVVMLDYEVRGRSHLVAAWLCCPAAV